MTEIRALFLQIRELFSNFSKRAGRPPPLRPSNYAPGLRSTSRSSHQMCSVSKGLLVELTHDVATTLGFGCIFVAMSDNVATILCFRRCYYDQKLRLLQRCVFDVDLPTWY